MSRAVINREVWAAMWRSENRIDGKNRHLLNENCLPVLFRTRRAAREYIEKRYGYIRTSKDLQVEPHGWRMPIPIRVNIQPKVEGTR
jgi:hypothetical protein